MPTKNPKPRKSKVRKLTKDNIFTSVAIASIICNILLLCIVYAVTRPDAVDYSLYTGVRNHFCNNSRSYNNMVQAATKDGESKLSAKQKFEIACTTGDFAPYFQQAVSSYEQAQK